MASFGPVGTSMRKPCETEAEPSLAVIVITASPDAIALIVAVEPSIETVATASFELAPV